MKNNCACYLLVEITCIDLLYKWERTDCYHLSYFTCWIWTSVGYSFFTLVICWALLFNTLLMPIISMENNIMRLWIFFNICIKLFYGISVFYGNKYYRRNESFEGAIKWANVKERTSKRSWVRRDFGVEDLCMLSLHVNWFSAWMAHRLIQTWSKALEISTKYFSSLLLPTEGRFGSILRNQIWINWIIAILFFVISQSQVKWVLGNLIYPFPFILGKWTILWSPVASIVITMEII